MEIDCAFPGGNILVDAIDGDVARIHQDLRDTEGDWFYWSFRVHGAQGRTVRFEFTRGNPIGVRGPALSTDGGKSWSWLGLEATDGASFRYTFASRCEHGLPSRFTSRCRRQVGPSPPNKRTWTA